MEKPSSKKAVAISPEHAEQLIQQIKTRRWLSIGQVLEALGAHHNACSASAPCKNNNRADPNCLCALVPLAGSYRKKGLWAKQASPLSSSDDDPAALARTKGQQCGLLNLGATCYANAALQCVFSVPSIRNAFFSLDNELSTTPVISQLQDLLLEMAFGPHAVADPEAFAEAMEIDIDSQEDGPEFFKSLLTKVDKSFQHSPNQDISMLMSKLFRGDCCEISTCRDCGNRSEGSSKTDHFNELHPEVVGFQSVEDSLVSLLEVKVMDAKKELRFCVHCSKETSFSVHVVLRKVPPVLCLSLRRYDIKANKHLDKITFPVTLDMAEIIARAKRKLPPELVTNGAPADDNDPDAPPRASGSRTSLWPMNKRAESLQPKYVDDMEVDGAAGGSVQGGEKIPGSCAGDMPVELERLLCGAVPDIIQDSGGKYDLAGVMIHKGPSAEHGHYVAHLKNSVSGHWWRFDDTVAEDMGLSPTTRPKDHGVSPATALADEEDQPSDDNNDTGPGTNKKEAGGGQRSKQNLPASDSKSTKPTEASSVNNGAGASGSGALRDGSQKRLRRRPGQQVTYYEVTSGNAYMLMYRHHGWKEEAVVEDASRLSADRRKQAWKLRDKHNKLCKEFSQATRKAAADILLRKKEVRLSLSIAPAPAYEDDTADEGFWIHTPWVVDLADADTAVPPIDNSSLMCCHTLNGKACMDPAKAISAKRISVDAWELFKSEYGGGPPLKTSDVCLICLTPYLESVVLGGQADLCRRAVMLLSKSPDSGNNAKGMEDAELQEVNLVGDDESVQKVEGSKKEAQRYVSEDWVQEWLKLRGADVNVGKSPTFDITCQHNCLLPSKLAQRLAISHQMFVFLARLWLHSCSPDIVTGPAKPASAITFQPFTASQSGAQAGSTYTLAKDTVDGLRVMEFPVVSSRECEACVGLLLQAEERLTALRSDIGAQKKVLSLLEANTPLTLVMGESYRLISESWLQHWLGFMTQNLKRATVLVAGSDLFKSRPPDLDLAVRSVLCDCKEHRDAPLLKVQPPNIVCKRGRHTQREPHKDVLRLIGVDVWDALSVFYPCMAGILATLQHSASSASASGAPAASNSMLTSRASLPGVELRTVPGLCHAALLQHEQASKNLALTYFEEEVMVEIVTEDKLPAPSAEGNAQGAGSKWKSKRAGKNRVALEVSSHTTVGQLRILIFQALRKHPMNQRMFIRGVEADVGINLTLADIEVYPYEEIRIVVTEEYDNEDVESAYILMGMEEEYCGDGPSHLKSKICEQEEDSGNSALPDNLMPAHSPTKDGQKAAQAEKPECMEVDGDDV